MALNYVSRGESVKASTVNSIIDAVAGGGNQSPDLIVTGTRSGPQFVAPAQLGSTTFDQSMLYDVDNYILSAWPMAKLKLGFTPSDCLNGLNIYQDSAKENPISAVVVHYNSSACPICGGTLSGKLLEDDDFAEDKAVGATGWVKTSIEGIHGSSSPIKMQLWESISGLYQVFTNASDDDTKKQLSTVLNDHNVDEAELSTLSNVKSWTLAYQTSLSSARGGGVPTSRLNIRHGAVDVYIPPAASNFNAVLKARLVCYKVNEQDDELTSYWTWLLPMGPDAEYDQSNEVVHSSQLTFGQDRILIEAEDGDLDGNFNGEATWLGNVSDTYGIKYIDTCIAYGKYEVTSNSLTANPVWLNLQYDYQKCAVVGNISLSASPSEENQNVLANKIFVAKADDIQLEDKVKVGDEAHEDKIFFGTLGDLFKDGPKLDAYTPLSAGVYMKSLEWTTRVPEEDEAIVSCRCMQLYNFDKAEADKQTSADLIIARRKTETGQELVYLSGITGGGGPSVPGPFEMTLSGQNASFRNCVMRVARAYFFYDDMTCTVPAGDQMVYSVLQHSETPSVTVSAGPYSEIAARLGTDWSNLLSTTVTPLYRVISGEVACDYRYMMNVQAYDSRDYQYWVG